MKKGLFVILLMAFVTGAFAQTADEVINKFVAASGGKEKLNAINTLQYDQVISVKSPMGNFEVPIKYYKDRNKMYRMEASMQFGGQNMNFFSVINDSTGYVMMPAIPMLGSEGGLKKLDEKERKLQAYQLDANGFFPDLVDYAAKGSKVELLKDDKVNKEDCYKIKLTMKTGQEITYLISKATDLVTRVDTKGTMAASMSGVGAMMGGAAGGRAERMEVSTVYSAYQDFNGVKIPTKINIKAAMGDSESTISNVKINEPIDPKLYTAK
jgi:outer membrane lipoprotein-sorting protein